MLKIETINIEKPSEVNLILGQSHFIKSVEDLHEALVSAVPGIKFGLAFAEASGPCLVRSSGTDKELTKLAEVNILKIGCGHVFLILLGNAYPINVLNAIKNVPEVCRIYCATANPVEVIVARIKGGGGVIGIVDGGKPRGIEGEKEKKERKEFLRKIGYKI